MTPELKAVAPKISVRWQARAEIRLKLILSVLEEGLELSTDFLKVDVVVTDEMGIQTLNLKHRKINRRTDVLSFETSPEFKKQGMMGSVVIGDSVMIAQAKALGHPVEHELDILLVHGVLHLLGMDHEKSKTGSMEMAQSEAEILRALGSKKLGLISRKTV